MSFKGLEKRSRSFFSGCRYIEILRFSMSAIIYWQNPCKLLISFRCIKAYMLAFSGRFSRASLEGISFKFFVCLIFNVSLGCAPKRKNFDIKRNTRVGSGGQFASNRLSYRHTIYFRRKELPQPLVEERVFDKHIVGVKKQTKTM